MGVRVRSRREVSGGSERMEIGNKKAQIARRSGRPALNCFFIGESEVKDVLNFHSILLALVIFGLALLALIE